MHLFPIFVTPNDREGLMEHLGRNGIETTVNYKPLHKFKLFSKFIRDKLLNTDTLGMGEISLPFYPNMPTEHVDIVVDAINEYFEGKK
jgi:dTDP-4-amino-4,6-dideoxygalactose transaminase